MISRELRTIRLSLESYPSISPFALDLVTGRGSAGRLCERRSLVSMAPRGSSRGRGELVEALKRANAAWNNDVGEALREWDAGESLTLIAGQQVGLGGGPLYTLAKIASLISLKRRFAAAGQRATVFFWLATEDHDFDEVARVDLLTEAGIETIRMTDPSSKRLVVGPREIPASLRRRLCQSLELPEGTQWLAPSITFRDSFARLIAEVVPGEVVLVDSLLPELRQAGEPFLSSITDRYQEAESEIERRSEIVEHGGYRRQVLPGENGAYRLLWLVDEQGERQSVEREGENWRVGGVPVDFPSIVRSNPERVSTGALTRPLLQDFVFEPDVFLGGPAEVAYYSQIRGLHEMFEVRSPHVALRGHVLAAPEKHLRALDRYAVEAHEVFDAADDILLRREADRVATLDGISEEMKSGLVRGIEAMKHAVPEIERSMEKSIDRSERRLVFHVEKLNRKTRRVVARHDRERYAAISRLCRTLNPGGAAQDRTIGWIGFWRTYGPHFVERLIEGAEPDCETFSIVGL